MTDATLALTLDAAPGATRLVPDVVPDDDGDQERADGWGFADTTFQVNAQGLVEVTGHRYPGISGHALPHLLPWFRALTGLPVAADDRAPSHFPPAVPPSIAAPALLRALADVLSAEQVSQDPLDRLRVGHGHTQSEIYALRHGTLPRVPDVVTRPASTEQVQALLRVAATHGAVVIPFGGGTNVSLALQCPATDRPIISVDMRRMRRVLWIDPVNRLACVEAGATGRQIQRTLDRHGFTIGHEPDSVEFSTLGGWIATNASGMKKNRYGNIEDLVLDMVVCTPSGTLVRDGVGPRESLGLDPTRWMLGSEGTLGIITAAVVRLFPRPAVQRHGSVILRDFPTGVRFVYQLRQAGVMPASVRLVDNVQFQFAMALRPPSLGLARVKSTLERALVTRLLRFDRHRMVVCTLAYEGTAREVRAQERVVNRLARRWGGLRGGASNGQRGYQLTFAIAYMRDFIMSHHFLAESFETSVAWSQLLPLCQRVKQRIHDECARRQLPGRPFVTCRVTQTYDSGACVYFYFATYIKGVADPCGVYHQIEAAARDEVLQAGGSLSHHHGVGKLRRSFLERVLSPAALDWRARLKAAVDPDNVLGAGNQNFGDGEQA